MIIPLIISLIANPLPPSTRGSETWIFTGTCGPNWTSTCEIGPCLESTLFANNWGMTNCSTLDGLNVQPGLSANVFLGSNYCILNNVDVRTLTADAGSFLDWTNGPLSTLEGFTNAGYLNIAASPLEGPVFNTGTIRTEPRPFTTSLTFNNCTLENHGSILLNDNNWTLFDPTETSIIRNHGTFQSTAFGSGILTDFENLGTVEITENTLSFGGSENPLIISHPQAQWITNGGWLWINTSRLQGTFTGNAIGMRYEITIVEEGATLNFPGGVYFLNAFSPQQITIEPGATLTNKGLFVWNVSSPGNAPTITGNIVNEGIWTDDRGSDGDLTLSNVNFHNTGTLLVIGNYLDPNANSTIVNDGIIRSETPTGGGAIYPTVINNHLIETRNGGIVAFLGELQQAPGSIIRNLSQMWINPFESTLNNGTVEGNGLFYYWGLPALINDGANLSPGTHAEYAEYINFGELDFHQGYTQTSDGNLTIDVTGNAAQLHDVIDIAGAASLAGTLNLRFHQRPQLGTSFQPVEASSVTGAFETINVTPSHITVEVTNISNGVTVTVTGNGCPRDHNLDGKVNAEDAFHILNLLNSSPGESPPALAAITDELINVLSGNFTPCR